MNTKVTYLGRTMDGVYIHHTSPHHVDKNGYVVSSDGRPINTHYTNSPIGVELEKGQVVKLTVRVEDVPQYIPGKWYLGRSKVSSEEYSAACYYYNGTYFCRVKDKGDTKWAKWEAEELTLHPTPIEHPFLEEQSYD